jgi:hypothetical protein
MSDAWTPGPWRVYRYDWRTVEQADDLRTIADIRYRPDGELIALAPEMAEAIMRDVQATECGPCVNGGPCVDGLCGIADKLRQINASSEETA